MSDNHDVDFIEYVVKQLVEKPESVQVNRTVDEMGVLIQLNVDPTDMGRVIGKEGRTAKALRTLLRVLGAKNNSRVNLKIIEPDGREVGGGHEGSDNDQHGHAAAPVEPKAVSEEAEQPIVAVDDGSEETPVVEPAADDADQAKDDDQAMEVL
jgi:predicted RNA-binding protein YlqC (UPF0109 family)